MELALSLLLEVESGAMESAALTDSAGAMIMSFLAALDLGFFAGALARWMSVMDEGEQRYDCGAYLSVSKATCPAET